MELGAIFFILVILALIVLFITRPFFEQRRIHNAQNDQELSSLLAERERLLATLQELDFDQSLGKIPAEDYPVQRAALLHKGAEVLRQLDSLAPGLTGQLNTEVSRSDGKTEPAASLSDDELEDLLTKRRTIRKEKAAGFCPKCGKPVFRSDVFCPSCGSALK